MTLLGPFSPGDQPPPTNSSEAEIGAPTDPRNARSQFPYSHCYLPSAFLRLPCESPSPGRDSLFPKKLSYSHCYLPSAFLRLPCESPSPRRDSRFLNSRFSISDPGLDVPAAVSLSATFDLINPGLDVPDRLPLAPTIANDTELPTKRFRGIRL
jgi:hypothetical protein